MAKKKIDIEIYSYGVYEKWDKSSKAIPRLLDITDCIPARLDIEFGYVLKIRGGRGKKLTFQIDHPPFTDAEGNIRPSFIGEHYINSNDWEFFLGDTVWEPISDKIGKWTLTTYLEGKVIAQKTLTLVAP